MGSGGIPRRYALAFSDKRHAFFTGHRDGDLAEWDTLTGRELARFGHHSSIENQFVIEKVFDNYLITNAKEKGWIIWDVFNGRMIKSSAVDMESDTFFTYVHERSIKVDENKKKTVLVRFEPGESADTRSRAERVDGTVKLIDTATGKEMAEFISFEDGEWIVITPEGYFNASPNGARHLSVRVGNNVYSIDNVYEKFFDPVQVATVLQRKKGEGSADIRKGILTPPDVTITSPGPNKEFSTDTITITVSAKDTGGGIDEIRLYHNGKAIGEDTRAIKIVPGAVKRQRPMPSPWWTARTHSGRWDSARTGRNQTPPN